MVGDQVGKMAKAYYDLGLNIVPIHLEPLDPATKEPHDPIKHKAPCIDSYKELHTRRQTPEEFSAIHWSDYVNAFAIVCGTKLADGTYLAVIDHDTKKLNQEIIAKGKELLKSFPTTQTEESGTKGVHLIYKSRRQVATDGKYHDICALELLGEKKLCIMAPSQGYKTLNDNAPTEIEDLQSLFYQILDKAGYAVQKETDTIEEKAQHNLFKIEKLLDLTKLTKISEYEYQGPHPYHDSTTDKNFCVNLKSDSWYCFRHTSGGGPMQLLAIKEGLLSCEDVKRGALKGAKYRKLLQLAIQEGLIDKESLELTTVNPNLIAKDILTQYTFIVDEETDKLYFYDNKAGIYSDKTKRLIKREIARYLDENSRASYYVDVEDYIRYTAPIVEMNKTPPELIAVKNGVLNVLTRELEDFSPNYYITTKIPVKYDAAADCPRIKKFLSEVLPEEHKQKLAQEHPGYCLYRKILWPYALMCIGKGANGKSVYLYLNTRLLGKDNVTTQTIQNLCYDRFSVAELHNKLANFSADLPSTELEHTGRFREIAAGDRQTGCYKFQNPFYFEPYAKLGFSCNETPPIPPSEDNDAYFRRWILLKFEKQFTGKNDNKNLKDEITTPEELSGYLNYVLEGLDRIMKQGDFSLHMTPEETRKFYIQTSNNAQAYIENEITVTDSEGDIIFNDVLFREYVTYCHKNGLKPKRKAEFVTAMGDFCTGAEKFRRRPEKGDNPAMAWRFIKTKTLIETPPKHPPKDPAQPGLGEYPTEDDEEEDDSDDDPRAGEKEEEEE
jgi:putative DNA primase/helicase